MQQHNTDLKRISVQMFTEFQLYRSQNKQLKEIKTDNWNSVENWTEIHFRSIIWLLLHLKILFLQSINPSDNNASQTSI